MQFDPPFPDLEKALSTERFSTYLTWADGDRGEAIRLYTLNCQLSESMYTPLHMLEVALRNGIHEVLLGASGPDWFNHVKYRQNARQPEMVTKAEDDLREANKAVTPGAMVAALTFGFWTSMVGKEYENLWQTTLHVIACRESGKGLTRKLLAQPLGPIRTLRNRIAHHESILHWNLPKHYQKILEIIRWLSVPAADWCEAHSRFNEVYPAQGIILATPGTAKPKAESAPVDDEA